MTGRLAGDERMPADGNTGIHKLSQSFGTPASWSSTASASLSGVHSIFWSDIGSCPESVEENTISMTIRRPSDCHSTCLRVSSSLVAF